MSRRIKKPNHMERILLMREALQWCDDNDKSIEFTIQYIQDYAGVSFEKVIDFLAHQDGGE